jgi:WD40 repeat protein
LPARIALIAALALVAPAAASGSSITFGCGSDLCRVSPSGHHRHRVTDFRRGISGTPERISIARGGGRMAFGDFEDTYVTDRRGRHRRTLEPVGRAREVHVGAQVSPDGRRLLWPEEFSPLGLRYICQGRIGGGGHCVQDHQGLGPFSWGPGGRVMSIEESERHEVCVVAKGRCARVLGRTRHDFFGPVQLSPDGRLIVVTDEIPVAGDTKAVLKVFDVRNARLVRTLTSGHRDTLPSWSPDGRRIAFARDDSISLSSSVIDGAICTVSVRGGHVRTIARGFAPSWSR